MSRVDDLIRELCPEGVPTQELSTLVIRHSGTAITATKMRQLDSPVGEIRVFAGGNTVATVPVDSIPAGDVIETPSVIVKSRGNIGFDYFDRPFSHKSELWSYSSRDSRLNIRFLFHYLESRKFQLHALARSKSVKLPQLSVRDTDGLKIPLPPTTIQDEIVRILDTFTALEAELEAELEARTTQYEETRNRLMAFDAVEGHPLSGLIRELCPEGVPRLTMSEVGHTYAGLSGKTKADFGISGSPFVSYMVVASNLSLPNTIDTLVRVGPAEKQNQIAEGDLLLTGSSEDLEGVGLACEVRDSPEDPTYLNSFCIGWRPDTRRFAKGFLGHVFASAPMRIQIQGCANGVTRMNISKKRLEKVEIPAPPLALQEEIVRVLDSFDSLVTDISVGLPAEIAARRKQYQYYRDKLLSFERLAV